MERGLLTLTLVAVVQCHLLSNGDTLQVTTVLGGAVIVKLEYPEVGLPIPNCCYNADLLQQPVLAGAVVTEMAHLNELGHLLRLDFVDNIVTCHLVPFVKDTGTLSTNLCPHLACPTGWNLLQNTCFLITQDSGSWKEGQSFCHQQGGSLATISSDVQQEALSHMLTGDTWIGLRYVHHKNTFSWDDGSAHTYSRWAQGQPNTTESLDRMDCVDMGQGYNLLWSVENCDETKLFLCSARAADITTVGRTFTTAKRSDNAIPSNNSTTTTTTTTTATPTTSTTTTTTARIPECETGWTRFQSSCYKLFSESASYATAAARCSDLEAYVTNVGSEEEHLFLVDLVGTAEYTFIGLTDREQEGTFIWDDGSSLNYTKWSEGEPNDYTLSEDCTEMRKSDSFKWNDIKCYYKRNFVCEKSVE